MRKKSVFLFWEQPRKFTEIVILLLWLYVLAQAFRSLFWDVADLDIVRALAWITALSIGDIRARMR